MTDIGKVKPRGPWVLIRRLDDPEKSDGGVYLPQGNTMQRLGHCRGAVIAAGRGEHRKKHFVEMPVSPGDVVVFRGFISEVNRPIELDHSLCLVHMKDIDLIDDSGSQAMLV